MPRKKKTPATLYETPQNIPPQVERPKQNRRAKVLAKMLLKEVKGNYGGSSQKGPINPQPSQPRSTPATGMVTGSATQSEASPAPTTTTIK